ncbi:MAG: hypothetical protein WCI61_05675 [Chloroflexota bacterium]
MLLLLVAVTLLGVGCQLRIVTGETVEESPDGPRVCLTYRYSGYRGPLVGGGTRTCVDFHGAPLTMRCYEDAVVGHSWPDACVDGRYSEWALAVLPVMRIAILFVPFAALALGLLGGAQVIRYLGSRAGWRPLHADVAGLVAGVVLVPVTGIFLFLVLLYAPYAF